jgi:hypothetical protein
MHHDHCAAELARLKADLLRDQRALVAEGQRLVLRCGRELVEMGGKIAGPAGEQEAARFADIVLWSEQVPDGWPIGAIIEMFRNFPDLSPGDRALLGDLLRPLLRLARSADDLHGLRAQLAELAATGRHHSG